MSNVTLKHTRVSNRAPLIARSISLKCILAAEHHTAEQYSKGAGQNPESISQNAIYAPSGSTGKVVASHAAVVRSIPAEVALIYTMHETLRGYCP